MRSIVNWSVAAPERPRHAADPFAPEYRLGDVDELVRNAEQRGIEVLLTIWGTPGWANGGARPNVAPTDPRDLRDFAHALAARYSGRHPGYPFVRFYTVWNEPNVGQFLSPQFDAAGRPVAPRVYASLVAAAYAGVKSASPHALVAAGETAPRGRDEPRAHVQDTESPARFARLVAAAAPDLRFDAWAHHPYPRNDLTLPRRAAALAGRRLHRASAASTPRSRAGSAARRVPLWVTEIAYRTSPRDPRARRRTRCRRRTLARALELARAQPGVRMLVWFVFRDEPGQPWQSGLLDHRGRAKPALARFAAASAAERARPAGRGRPDDASCTPSACRRSSCARISTPGARLGVRYSLAACGKSVAGGMTAARMGADGWVPVTTRLPRRARDDLPARPADRGRARPAGRSASCRSRRRAPGRRAGSRPPVPEPRVGSAAMARPVVGITTYLARGAVRRWDTESALVPADYVRAIERAGGRPLLVPPSTDGIDETLDALDGLVFSGGSDIDPELYGHDAAPGDDGEIHRERDDAELALLQAALARDMPVLAICRGSQLLNVARGGDLVQHLPETSSATTATRRSRPSSPSTTSTIDEGTMLHGSSASTRRSSRTTTRASAAWATGCASSAHAEDGSPEALEATDATLRARRALAPRGGRGRAAVRGARRAGGALPRRPQHLAQEGGLRRAARAATRLPPGPAVSTRWRYSALISIMWPRSKLGGVGVLLVPGLPHVDHGAQRDRRHHAGAHPVARPRRGRGRTRRRRRPRARPGADAPRPASSGTAATIRGISRSASE